MKKTIKSWNGNPETEPDYKSEIKSFSIIADVIDSGNTAISNIFETVNKIADLSESYNIEDVNFDDDGYTIFADILIDDSSCYFSNFDKLKLYFSSVGDIFYTEQENHFETMADIFKP